MRALTRADVTILVEAEQDDLPVRGNALASGDDEVDRECEDEIIRRLDSGDVWAWANVRVIVSWGDWEGEDCLGACSYRDENDFREPGGYFDDMVNAALDCLNAKVRGAAEHLESLR